MNTVIIQLLIPWSIRGVTRPEELNHTQMQRVMATLLYVTLNHIIGLVRMIESRNFYWIRQMHIRIDVTSSHFFAIFANFMVEFDDKECFISFFDSIILYKCTIKACNRKCFWLICIRILFSGNVNRKTFWTDISISVVVIRELVCTKVAT